MNLTGAKDGRISKSARNAKLLLSQDLDYTPAFAFGSQAVLFAGRAILDVEYFSAPGCGKFSESSNQ